MPAPRCQPLLFDFLPSRELIVERSAGQITSDAGLLPIRQFDQQWGYTERMAACLLDPQPRRQQSLLSMLRQRIFGILAGYEDCNDHDTLRHDPVLKMVADRLPEEEALASQPTLSRFENLATPAVLLRLIDFLVATGVERLKQRHGGGLPASVTLDVDATDDPTHGQQQLTFFHGYFEQYQYFPLIISEPTTKHVFTAWLRPGTLHASLGAADDLMRVVNALRRERPDIQIHVRADAGFAVPDMYEVCERNSLTYTFGFSTNSRLKARTTELLQQAVAGYEKTGEKQRLFDTFDYQCDSWSHTRRIIVKAECHPQGTNLRFVVTNRPQVVSPADAQREYDEYVQRGESEQRMDELKHGVKMDRLSCHRFKANFFRLILYTATMNLINALRDHPSLPPVLRHGQPCTWRSMVIKVAATVIQSTRRVVVKLSGNWPWWHFYQLVAERSNIFRSTA